MYFLWSQSIVLSHYFGEHSVLHGPSASCMIRYAVRCAPPRDIMCTVLVRYSIVPTLRRDSQIFTLKSSTVQWTVHTMRRSSSLVKKLERQWRNGWCLTRRLAISVTSQVGYFFSVSALDVNLWRRIKVSNGDLTYGGLSWASNIRRKKSKDFRFFPPHSEMRHFYWTDFFEIRATTQSIQVVQKKNQTFIPRLHSALRTTWQAYRRTERQQETRSALGPKGLASGNPVCGMPLFSQARLQYSTSCNPMQLMIFSLDLVMQCTPRSGVAK